MLGNSDTVHGPRNTGAMPKRLQTVSAEAKSALLIFLVAGMPAGGVTPLTMEQSMSGL